MLVPIIPIIINNIILLTVIYTVRFQMFWRVSITLYTAWFFYRRTLDIVLSYYSFAESQHTFFRFIDNFEYFKFFVTHIKIEFWISIKKGRGERSGVARIPRKMLDHFPVVFHIFQKFDFYVFKYTARNTLVLEWEIKNQQSVKCTLSFNIVKR